MQPKKLGQGKNRQKSASYLGKDSTRPVLGPFGPAKAAYILSSRIYAHVETVVNAVITMQVIFQNCLNCFLHPIDRRSF